MSLIPSPLGGNGDNSRRLYPLVVIPMLAILLIVGGLAFYVKSQAAPASRLVSLTRSQLPTAVPTNTTWYFDGGSVGGGFQEYLTMQNPNPSVDANVTITYFLAEADSTNAPSPGQPDYNTFVSVLNPSPTLNANATITYYTGVCGASGQAACPTQQVSLIPLQRQVLKPTIGLGYHQQFTISVVSSDNPIIAERLLYVKDNIATAGGWTTGAIMGVGATAPGRDWLFAEGYTGSGFQEDYKLANF